MKKYIFYSIILLALAPELSFAAGSATIGDLVNNLFQAGHLGAISKFMEAVAYLGGVALGFKGILKLQEWSESKGQKVKLTVPIIYLLCAGLMLGLPNVIQMGFGSFFGTSASQQFNSSGQYGGQY